MVLHVVHLSGFFDPQTLPLIVILVVSHLFANLLFLLVPLIKQWLRGLLRNRLCELNRRCRLNDLRR